MKIQAILILALIFIMPVSGAFAQNVELELINDGNFEMGDHHNLGGLEHSNDEIPIHTVRISSFYIGKYELTNKQYCDYLNSAFSQRLIEVRNGLVYAVGGNEIYCETRKAVPHSIIDWDGNKFSVLDNKDNHPIVCIRWQGAIAYCNWLSSKNGYQSCYDLSTGKCDFTMNGFRLPTEAEWEYAARGGKYSHYYIYPWGDDADYTKANWPDSKDPYETGSYPWTTPVGFYDGKIHYKVDFGWPGSQESYKTSDGSNGYGLYDMAGNVWEWCNDWYKRDHYSSSPKDNPKGPNEGTPMPDGKTYHVLRGGNWYNGPEGHSRVSNRNPAYYRGPDDPNHAWYHIGFRIARSFQGNNQGTENPPPNNPPQGTGTGSIQRQIGLIKNDSRAFKGYTLFAPKHYTVTYLMDNDGNIVNSWESDYEPGQAVYLLENGHLLHCCFTKNQNFIGGGEGGGIEEYDWDGNLLWEFWYTSDKYLMHHDIEPSPNGNILALVVEKKSYNECIAAGFNPDLMRDREMFPDYVIEIEKIGTNSGRIVWEWHVWDHLIQDYDPSRANYSDVADHPELIDANGSGRGVPAFWNHMNSIDYNAELNQIILSVRGNSEFWVIDHSATTGEAAGHTGGRSGKGGDLLYRWGNPQTYQAGDARDQKLFEQHDAQWIEPGCPGEGNILVFNNGLDPMALT